jgi:hypothetical protein
MSDAAKYAVIASTAFSDASFDPTSVATQPYKGTWGGDLHAWQGFQTEDGFSISFDVGYEAVQTDAAGIVDYRLQSSGVIIKCKPVGVSESDVLALINVQGFGVRRGMSLGDNASALVLYSDVTPCALISTGYAHAVEAGYTFGNGSTLRHGELGFVSIKSFYNGAPAAILSITDDADPAA